MNIAWLLLFLCVCHCGPLPVTGFQAETPRFLSSTESIVRTVEYDYASGEYNVIIDSNTAAMNHNQLSAETRSATNALLDKINVRKLKSKYGTDSPVGATDGTYVQVTFFSGEKKKDVFIDTVSPRTPKSISQFVDLLRTTDEFY